MRFLTPKTDAGFYEVVIQPKTCAQPCAEAIRFMFEQVDATLPEVVSPVPQGVSFQTGTFPPLYLRNVPDTADLQSFVLEFDGQALSTSISVNYTEDIRDSMIAGVKVLMSARTPPQISQAGQFMVRVSFTQRSGVSKDSLPFSFQFYDGFLPRVVFSLHYLWCR